MHGYYVERGQWQRWPRVIIVCHDSGQMERRRYVPERTCHLRRGGNGETSSATCSECGYSEEMDGSYVPGDYCPGCGAKVVDDGDA